MLEYINKYRALLYNVEYIKKTEHYCLMLEYFNKYRALLFNVEYINKCRALFYNVRI